MRVNNVWQKHAMKKHISISVLQTWHLSHEEFHLWDFNISFSHYDTKNFIYCNKGNFSHKVENICYKSVHPKNQKKKPCLTICDQLAQVCSKKKYYRKFQVLIAQKCPRSFYKTHTHGRPADILPSNHLHRKSCWDLIMYIVQIVQWEMCLHTSLNHYFGLHFLCIGPMTMQCIHDPLPFFDCPPPFPLLYPQTTKQVLCMVTEAIRNSHSFQDLKNSWLKVSKKVFIE